MGRKWRVINRLGSIIFVIVGITMFYISYDNWQMDQEFLASAKGRSLGTVHIEQGVQTVNFPENSYGVSIDGKRKEGEQVYIYYQKDKPYRISTSPIEYQTKQDIIKPLLGGIFFIGYALLAQDLSKKCKKQAKFQRIRSEF